MKKMFERYFKEQEDKKSYLIYRSYKINETFHVKFQTLTWQLMVCFLAIVNCPKELYDISKLSSIKGRHCQTPKDEERCATATVSTVESI